MPKRVGRNGEEVKGKRTDNTIWKRMENRMMKIFNSVTAFEFN